MQDLETLSDNTLLHKYLKKDNQQAFTVLFKRYEKQIYYYILKIVKDKHIANDIFQKTHFKVLTKVDDLYEEQGKWISWVMRIAYNNCIDHFRKQKKFVDVSQYDNDYNEDYFDRMESESDPEADYIYKKDIEYLNECISQLPEEQQVVINMRLKSNTPFKEIAKKTDVSINTALSRMRYARINLKKMLEEYQVDYTKD